MAQRPGAGFRLWQEDLQGLTYLEGSTWETLRPELPKLDFGLTVSCFLAPDSELSSKIPDSELSSKRGTARENSIVGEREIRTWHLLSSPRPWFWHRTWHDSGLGLFLVDTVPGLL